LVSTEEVRKKRSSSTTELRKQLANKAKEEWQGILEFFILTSSKSIGKAFVKTTKRAFLLQVKTDLFQRRALPKSVQTYG
jgi:dsDNA-specific endonuclease/ATPase MutS2